MDEKVDSGSSSQNNPQHVSYSRDKSPIWNVFDKFISLFSNRTTAIAGILVLVIGLGAGIIAIQRSTEFRQQAATTTGQTSNSIVGPITEINNGEIKMLNTRDGKNYRILVTESTPITKNAVTSNIQDLKVSLHITAYSSNEFIDNAINDNLSHIIITGDPIQNNNNASGGEIPIVGGDKSQGAIGNPNAQGK